MDEDVKDFKLPQDEGISLFPQRQSQWFTSTQNMSDLLQTPIKINPEDDCTIEDDFSNLSELETPSSAIKKEVAKFCEEINFDYYEPAEVAQDEIPPGTTVVSAESLQYLKKVKKEKRFCCAHCNASYADKELLLIHMRNHLEVMPFKCDECNIGFMSKNNYTKHKNLPHPLEPHKCTQCNKEFTKKKYLTKHTHTVHKKELKLKCPECDFYTQYMFLLKTHAAAKHWKDKPFKCSACPYETHNKLNLQRHEKVHTSERSYVCKWCRKSFKRESNLGYHQRTKHKDATRYTCEFCFKTIGEPSRLRRHIEKMHRRDEPIYCRECQENYVDISAFRMHRKKKLGTSCPRKLCDFKGYTDCDNKAHALTHFSVKMQICQICKANFRNTSDLKSHLLSHASLMKCIDCGGNFNQKRKLQLEVTIPSDIQLDNEGTSAHMGNNTTITINTNIESKENRPENMEIKKEPYVILEVMEINAGDGEKCVQYNLLREDDIKLEPKPVILENNVEENKKVKIKVLCSNKIHKNISIFRRFDEYVQKMVKVE